MTAERVKAHRVICRGCNGNGCEFCDGKGYRKVPFVPADPSRLWKGPPMMLNKKCPAGCNNGRVIGLGGTEVKCPSCNGLGFVTEEIDTTRPPGFVPAPPPASPIWLQAVIAIAAAIAAVAGAYSAAQSNKNAGTLNDVHAVQKDNAKRIREIHKEVAPKSALPAEP